MAINAKMVKELRTKTGAGMMDCKRALEENDGDFEKAMDWLRTKGIAKAAKKASRAATEGLVYSYIHGGGRIGVLIEVNCETDFVAKTDDFAAFTKDLAMQIAAMAPGWVSEEDVPAEVVEREKAIAKAQAVEQGKPEHIAEKMVAGKLKKFYAENTLLGQAFIKDEDKTVGDVVTEAVARIGENIRVRRFTRFVLGEGLEKKQDDFVAEVAAMTGA